MMTTAFTASFTVRFAAVPAMTMTTAPSAAFTTSATFAAFKNIAACAFATTAVPVGIS
jgi:hypothetical protein